MNGNTTCTDLALVRLLSLSCESQARNQPRLFDNIRPVGGSLFAGTRVGMHMALNTPQSKVRIGPRDLEPLDLTHWSKRSPDAVLCAVSDAAIVRWFVRWFVEVFLRTNSIGSSTPASGREEAGAAGWACKATLCQAAS